MTVTTKAMKWRQIMADSERSGKSQVTFCESNNISHAQFSFWCKQFSEAKKFSTQSNNGKLIKIDVAQPERPVAPII